jgi:hypothetical protein
MQGVAHNYATSFVNGAAREIRDKGQNGLHSFMRVVFHEVSFLNYYPKTSFGKTFQEKRIFFRHPLKMDVNAQNKHVVFLTGAIPIR